MTTPDPVTLQMVSDAYNKFGGDSRPFRTLMVQLAYECSAPDLPADEPEDDPVELEPFEPTTRDLPIEPELVDPPAEPETQVVDVAEQEAEELDEIEDIFGDESATEAVEPEAEKE